MARTYDSTRLRLQQAADRRLTDAHRVMAQAIGGFIARAATQTGDGGERFIPDTRAVRATLKTAVWSQVVKPFYIGLGDDPFADAEARSPYARLLRDSIEAAIRNRAEQQAALVNRTVRDERVVQWLTGPRPFGRTTEQRGVYDPFHLWVDPNGYRLSDRVWQNSIQVRANIDAFLDYHISAGTSAVRMAEQLEAYLTPGSRGLRTRTPYGREGSYPARRLARTEITAASGRATVNASIANPFVSGVQWVLSASHREPDPCNDNANGGPNGDGIYPPDQVPPFPNHSNCLCNLQPVVSAPAPDVADLRADIEQRTPFAEAIQGILNPQWLTQAILFGFIHEAIGRVQAARRLAVAAEVLT